MMFLPALTGEIVGSLYEFGIELHTPSLPFSIDSVTHCFTDETILVVASCDSILTGISHREALLKWVAKWPHLSYGDRFLQHIEDGAVEPYQSFGNGCLARALPHAYAYDNLNECVESALEAVSITHDHPESLKATEVFVSLIFLARTKAVDRQGLRKIASKFYDLDSQWTPIERTGCWESCGAIMVPGLKAAFESPSYEHALLLAMQQADSDSCGFLVGGLWESMGLTVPLSLEQQALALLPADIVDVLSQFERRFANGKTAV